MTRPKVVVVLLGGTIVSLPPASGGGAVPTLSVDALLAQVPDVAAVAEIVPVAFRQLPGAHVSMDDLFAVARQLRRLFDDGITGAVVPQGTDTIEETAFFLDCVMPRGHAVIVTGAMRGPSILGTDGAANLSAAIRVAAAPDCQQLGAMVVMHDEIHSGRWVRKSHTSSTGAFRSPDTGPIGWVAEGTPRIAMQPVSRPCLSKALDGVPGSVAIVSCPLGDDGRMIGLASEAGHDGIVVEAMGGGHVTPAAADAIAGIAGRMPVVIVSRTGSGETLRNTYGFAGSEIDLAARGAIMAGALGAPKARLLLSLLIAAKIIHPADCAAQFALWT